MLHKALTTFTFRGKVKFHRSSSTPRSKNTSFSISVTRQSKFSPLSLPLRHHRCRHPRRPRSCHRRRNPFRSSASAASIRLSLIFSTTTSRHHPFGCSSHQLFLATDFSLTTANTSAIAPSRGWCKPWAIRHVA